MPGAGRIENGELLQLRVACCGYAHGMHSGPIIAQSVRTKFHMRIIAPDIHSHVLHIAGRLFHCLRRARCRHG